MLNPQTNAISLRGNANVRVLIDGKPSNIDASQLLQQIPSASIKQIELITNPSAKTHPEGMIGIINIVLNKNSKIGLNGSINNGVTFGKTPKINSALDLNYRNGKFNFYRNYGLNHGKNNNYGFIKSEQENKQNTQLFQFNNLNTSHLAKIGIDYYIDDNNTVSFYTNQSFFNGKGLGSIDVDYVNDAATDLLQLFTSDGNNHSQTYNFDYKIKFKKEGHSLELEVNYNENDNPENAVYTNFNRDSKSLINSFTNDVATLGKNTIINLDYVNPLTDTTKLELGLEARDESTANNLYKDNTYSSNFTYDRKIYSAYVTLGKQWEKWSFQAGARLEQYNVEAVFKQASSADGQFNWESQSVIWDSIIDLAVAKTKSSNENKETRTKPKVVVDFYMN